ncbi:solute carrier family 43 member 3-like [Gigantopelta aegis]|uniref:solute carrier family 43 member 3-like n=1 Tax=Gigantopelta aegis TaxID=1735272 RepID=UPI001B8896FF|nr:solute carrier family 43 member 3-like [Gigantopelta aegis]
MTRVCTKQMWALSWAGFECLLFAGVVLGWSWFLDVFRTDRYFVTMCNNTNFTDFGMLNEPRVGSIYRPITARPKPKCRPIKTKKREIEYREEYTIDNLTQNHHLEDDNIPVADGYAAHVVSNNSESDDVKRNSIGCAEQSDQLYILFALVLIIRDVLALPIGIFFDKYGTTRTRLLTVLVFVIGTLMMTFTSAAFPWLIVPALSLTGAAGTAVLLTNLQLANLMIRKRNTVASTLVGAYFSSGVVTFLMQSSHHVGVNIQTSFMFLTIGIVPILVSTVAFLPKTRIPWPLPLDYQKRRNQSLDESLLRKQRAWQRRMSEVGNVRCRKTVPEFSPAVIESMYVWSVVWYSVQYLQTAIFETRLIGLTEQYPQDNIDYEKLYGFIQMLSVLVSPLAGLMIDRHRKRDIGVTKETQLMLNILPVMFTTSVLSVSELVTSMVPAWEARIASFVINVIHRVFLMTSLCTFIMHAHFPQQHFGKFFGLTLAMAAVAGAFQFPMKTFLIEKYESTMQINILLLCLSLVVIGHPINVWNHCKRRLIHNNLTQEDHKAALETSHPQLTQYQDYDESKFPNLNGGLLELELVERPPVIETNLDDFSGNGDITIVVPQIKFNEKSVTHT